MVGAISHRMALQNVPVLIGIHIKMPGTVSMEIEPILAAGGPPQALRPRKKHGFRRAGQFLREQPRPCAMMVSGAVTKLGQQELHKNPASPRLRETRN